MRIYDDMPIFSDKFLEKTVRLHIYQWDTIWKNKTRPKWIDNFHLRAYSTIFGTRYYKIFASVSEQEEMKST